MGEPNGTPKSSVAQGPLLPQPGLLSPPRHCCHCSIPPVLSQPLRFCPAPRGHAKQMSPASAFVPEDCRVVSPRLLFLQTEPIQFVPRWLFSKLGVVLASLLFPPPSLYLFEGVAAQNWTRDQGRAGMSGLPSRPGSCCCAASSFSNNTTPLAAADPPYPQIFPTQSTARSLPSACAGYCSCINAQPRAFLLDCVLFHPDRFLGVPSSF